MIPFIPQINRIIVSLFFLFLLSPATTAWLEKSPLDLATVSCSGYPPIILASSSTLELFLVKEKQNLYYYQLNAKGQVLKIILIKELPFPVAYLQVKKESFGYILYMVSEAPMGEREWRILLLDGDREPLSFFGTKAPLPEPRDLEVLVVDQTLHLFTVEGRQAKLYWRRFTSLGEELGEPQIISEHLHLGVPRGIVEDDETFYLVWRRSYRFHGYLSYAIFQGGELVQDGDLGDFPYHYIIGLSTRPLTEEVGPVLTLREGGGFWVAWTRALYDGFRELSMIQVLEVCPWGGELSSFFIEGQEHFALFPSLWRDGDGQLHLAWEEMVGGRFDIYYSPIGEGINPKRITYSYSHHRLVRGLSLEGEVVFSGRKHTKGGDKVWLLSSSFPVELGLRNWGIFGDTKGEKLGEIFLSVVSLVVPLLMYLGSLWPLLGCYFFLVLLFRWLGILYRVPIKLLLPGILGLILLLWPIFYQGSFSFIIERNNPLIPYSRLLSSALVMVYMCPRRDEIFDEITYLGLGLLWFFLFSIIELFWQAGFILTP